MPINKNPQNHFSGHSVFHALIHKEAELVSSQEAVKQKNDSFQEDRFYTRKAEALDWPVKEEDQFLSVHPCKGKASALVLFSGVVYLLNPLEGAFQEMQDSKIEQDSFPSNIILMSWEDSEIKGLLDYCTRLRKKIKNKKLIIWTAELGWEAVGNFVLNKIRKKDHSLDKDLCTYFLKSKKVLEEEEEKNSNTVGIYSRQFKNHAHQLLAPGVEIDLYFSVSSTPSIQVRFRLFDHYLTICSNHNKNLNNILRLPDVSTYQKQILNPLYQNHPGAEEVLKSAIQRRIEECVRFGNNEKKEEGPQFDIKISNFFYCLKEQIFYKEKGKNENKELSSGFLIPKQLSRNGIKYSAKEIEIDRLIGIDKIIKTVFDSGQTNNFALQKEPEKVLASKLESSAEISLACGRSSARSGGRISPLTRISLEFKNFGEINISLLGLKILEFLLDQKKQTSVFNSQLIILTSPYTENPVRQEVARLVWEFDQLGLNFQARNVLFLRQTIAPLVNKKLELFRTKWPEEKSGIAKIRPEEVGMFRFVPTGHFDLLRALLEYFKGQKNTAPKYIYHTNFDNTGLNINKVVLGLKRKLNQLKDQKLVALFELADYEKSLQKGSFWGWAGKKNILLKKDYTSTKTDGISTEWNASLRYFFNEGETRYMSTNSVLFDFKNLTEAFKNKLPDFNRRDSFLSDSDSIDPDESPIRLERDLDQLTFFFPCDAVLTLNPGKESYRFLPVKSESDLYKNRLEKIRQNLINVPISNIRTKKNVLPDFRPFILAPVTKHDPWGGWLIMKAKELAPIREKLSETWESSLHPKGESGILFDALHSVPLSQIAGETDVMVKILDCNSWLSFQLHPSKAAAALLAKELEEPQNEANPDKRILSRIFSKWDFTEKDQQEIKKELNKREDDRGKEEIFYIIENHATKGDNYMVGLNLNSFNNLKINIGDKEIENGFEGVDEKVDNEKIATDNNNSELVINSRKKPIEETSLFKKIINSAFAKLKTWIEVKTISKSLDKEMSEQFELKFKEDLKRNLPIVLALRKGYTDTKTDTLKGILFIFAIQTIQEILKENRKKKPYLNLIRAYKNRKLKLFDYFYKIRPKEGTVLHIRSGVLHAGGPGIYKAEISNQSDNTFRIYDHGRALNPDTPRSLHHLLASISLSSESFVNKQNENHFISSKKYISQDNIRMEVLSGENLSKEIGHPVGDKANDALIVLCTKGEIHLRTAYSIGGYEKKIDLNLPAAYTAIVPKTTNLHNRKVNVKSKRWTDSECIVIYAKAQTDRAFLSIAIGNTHYEFIYKRPSEPPRQKMYYWGTLFPEQKKENQFLKEVRDNLADFLSKSCDPKEELIFKSLSWPYYIYKKNALLSTKLKVDALDPAKLVNNIKINQGKEVELNIDVSTVQLRFDIEADLLAEVLNPLGKLKRQSGILLNISSGICIGIFQKKESSNVSDGFKLKVRNKKGQSFIISAIGQLVWYVPDGENKWFFDDKFTEEESEKTAKDTISRGLEIRPKPKKIKKDAMRLSKAFGSTALVLRYLLIISLNESNRLFKKNLKTNLNKCEKEQLKKETYKRVAKELIDHIKSKVKLPAETSIKMSDVTSELESCLIRLANKDQANCEKFSECITQYRPFLNIVSNAVFEIIMGQINEEHPDQEIFDSSRNTTKRFVQSMGWQFGDLIAFLITYFQKHFDHEILRTCYNKFIIGGFGGKKFGNPFSDNDPEENLENDPDKEYENDIFHKALCWQLKQHNLGFHTKIERSKVSRSPYRLLESELILNKD